MSVIKLQTIDSRPLEERLQGARSFCDKMLAWVAGRGDIVIVVHDNPDPDSLASALALRLFFREKIFFF